MNEPAILLADIFTDILLNLVAPSVELMMQRSAISYK